MPLPAPALLSPVMTVLYAGLPAPALPHLGNANPPKLMEPHRPQPATSPVDTGAARKGDMGEKS